MKWTCLINFVADNVIFWWKILWYFMMCGVRVNIVYRDRMSLLVNISGMIKKCAQHLNSFKYFKKVLRLWRNNSFISWGVGTGRDLFIYRSVSCRKTRTLLIAMTQFLFTADRGLFSWTGFNFWKKSQFKSSAELHIQQTQWGWENERPSCMALWQS